MGIFTEDYSMEIIVLGGGCFWCTEAIFKMLKGIISVEPGYAGGNKENPTYEEVLAGNTGHAEVVRVTYDPKIISFNQILTVFFATHDPTTLNKQGNDVGEQYRSIILCATKKQRVDARKFIEELNNSSRLGRRIVTHVSLLDIFYPAEEEHKDYLKKHPDQAYCRVTINPKLGKVKQKFKELLENINE
ncbi:MAG: peptide-methionine (S)-S-oxide reductase MsrA [Candidatus Staskawiczbacteria bacterium]|nr:peptide-methionine (S)-S-oxide reductase MsrA [Candidatus Staskawiczbacteria bacterium]